MRIFFSLALAAVCFAAPQAASAETDDAPELWLNPSVTRSLGGGAAVRLETAQRLRRESDGRSDTYLAQLWVNQAISPSLTVSGGVERRENDPGAEETRLLQQLSIRRGVLRSRLRLEQRFIEDGRVGVRLRPRLGVEVPVAASGRLSALANAELFLALRSPNRGGDTGLTTVRTQLGGVYKVNDRLSVTLAYLRQQEIREDRPDVVGHAPLIGVEVSF